MAKKNNQGKSLKQQAYEELTKMFLNEELKQGDPLLEVELSEKLKISRTPLREAFLQLEKEGIVEIIPRKGAFIKRLTLKDITELFQIREAIEGMATSLAATVITEEQFQDINKYFEKAEMCRDSGEFQKTAEEAGQYLHDMILKISGNRRIGEILSSYQLLLMNEQNKAARKPELIEKAYQEHRAILLSLQKGAVTAESTMRFHIRRTLTSIIQQTI